MSSYALAEMDLHSPNGRRRTASDAKPYQEIDGGILGHDYKGLA